MSITRREMISNSLTAAAGLAALHGFRSEARAQAPGRAGPLRVQLVIFDGVLPTDVFGPFDALRLATNLGEDAIEVELVTPDDSESVTAQDGVVISTTAALDLTADALLVPGAPRVWREGIEPAGLYDLMRAFREPGKLLFTVCTGGVFAARAGLFQGRNANTHKSGHTVLTEQGGTLVPVHVVDDGDLISSGGVVAGIDLALYVIERFAGAALAIRVEEVIEYERRGTVWRR
jgi:transcriptional regulator GlxA family with amidase domain